MERWQEEVEILTQEFRRAIRGFQKMDEVWMSLAADSDGSSESKGKTAYAKKKAAMYRRMAQDCRETFAKLGGTWVPEGVSLGDHIRAERPSQNIDWTSGIQSLFDSA